MATRKQQMEVNSGANSSTARAWAEIDLVALRSNIRSLQRFVGPQCGLMAVVKADGYGHGLVPVARAAADAGADWLGVAAVSEGIALRQAGISTPVALLCVPPPADAADIVAYRLTAQVGDPELLEALAQCSNASGHAIHIEVDTGMGRSGVLPDDAVVLWRSAVASGLRVTGLSTHFACSEGPDDSLNRLQWLRFTETRVALEAAGACFEHVHAANSGGALRFPRSGCTLVRPGMLIYGIAPEILHPPLGHDGDMANVAAAPTLQPVLALKARIGSVRTLPAGHTISYGATYCLRKSTRVATVLIGYGDGYPRRLSNCGSILVRGQAAPILGRVCMDQTVVDVTHIPDAAAGDVAVCIGRDGASAISASQLARQIDGAEQEITTCLATRLPRLYRG